MMTAMGIGVSVGGKEVCVLVGLDTGKGDSTPVTAVCSIPQAETNDPIKISGTR